MVHLGEKGVRTAMADGDFGQLEAFLAAGPRGRLREKCAFLETLGVYVDRCEAEFAYPDEVLTDARQWIMARAEELLTDERAGTSRARVEAIIARASGHTG